MNGTVEMDMSTSSASPGSTVIPETDGRLIDLRRVAATLRRRQWWVLATVGIVLALTAFAYLALPRRYSANAVVALDRKVGELVSGQTGSGGDSNLLTDSPSVDTAVQVLTSPALATEVVDSLQLAQVEGFGQAAGKPFAGPEIARRRAVGAVRSGLTVKRTGVSYAISVAYQGANPQTAAKVVNAIVDRYVADQQTGKESLRGDQITQLRNRLQSLRADVIRAETAEARYRGATNLIDVQKDSTAVQQGISVLSTQLATAQADEAAARAKLAAVVSTGVSPATDAAASSVISSLRGQQAQLSAQRADLAQRYGELHPDLARINKQLADVNASIASESGRVRSTLAANVREASGRTGSLAAALGRAQGGLSAGNTASVQLAELQRNSDSARGLYQAFLDRFRQAVAGQGTDRSDAYVISHALVPGAPDFPQLPLFLIGGIVAGLLAAAVLVLVLEMLESGFQSRQDVESKLGLPVLANVPDLRSLPGARGAARGKMGPANYLIENDGTVFGESFRSIRTALRLGHPDQVVRSLAICSALPGEGKTTTAICLARSAAMAGMRVVLVDCDMRRRASSRSMMADDSGVGLMEVLKGEATLDQALLGDEPTGMQVLAQSRKGAGGYDLLTSQTMEQLVRDLGLRFDFVVLDTAPILPLAEARAVAGMADGVVFVTRWRKTPVRAAQLALEMLGRAGAHVHGAAITLVNLKSQARGDYGDEMTYYNQFKSYYA